MKKKIDPIGPQTKREARKSDRQDKRAIRRTPTPMAAPKINRSIETPASKAAKRKQNIKSVGAAIGVVGATVGTILADARLNRGTDRVRGGRANVKVSAGDAWRAGKNKKSTKK